jgi:hypothetical protein
MLSWSILVILILPLVILSEAKNLSRTLHPRSRDPSLALRMTSMEGIV